MQDSAQWLHWVRKLQNPTISVDAIYRILREMATNFDFLPDQKINENTVAEKLGASRTPVREALNRLAGEGFIRFEIGKGFYCRSLDPNKVLSYFEARVAIECEALRLSVQRASDSDISDLQKMVAASEALYHSEAPTADMVDLDESFHLGLVTLSKSEELERMARNINAMIRYVRSIDMTSRHSRTPGEHLRILEALAERDTDKAVSLLRAHIERRSEEIVDAVRRAFSELYVPVSMQ